MKILQINAVYKNSSTGRICFDLHEFLIKNLHECLTVYGNRKCEYPDSVYVGNFLTQKFSALVSRITGKIGYSRFNTKKIIKIIKEYKPDVVHIHNLHANFVSIPKLLEYIAKNDLPTVVTLHDCFFYTGGCTHYTANGCYKWQKRCQNCKFNNLTWLFDKTSKMFDDKKRLFSGIKNLAVVGVSDWITKEAKQSPIFEHAKTVQRIYNGIDLSLFRPINSDFRKRLNLEDKKIILGVSSGWSEKSDRKGFKVFCSLARLLKDNEIIVLVGTVEHVCLPDNIINIPATNDIGQLVDIYNAVDVFLQASTEETFGQVVAESLACGTPVVTNTSTANPELINDKCGTVIKEFTVDNIYNAIEEIFAKGKAEYSANCIQFAKNNFNKENNYKQYLEVYKRLNR